MPAILLLLILSLKTFANDPLDHKKGFMFGLGGNIAQSTFPVQFQGVTKNKIDDSSTLYGPVFNLGYDVVLFSHILLGLRGEAFVADSLNSGNKENSTSYDKTAGKIRAGSASVRLGFVFNFKSLSPIGTPTQALGEFFAEGGITSGHKSFSKNYSITGAVTESYHENLEEEYQGRVLAGGFNYSSLRGPFFELKVSQTSVLSNKQTFTGRALVNGGAVGPTDQKLVDENKSGFTTLMMTFGYHY